MEGEINDPYGEFFVRIDDKYVVTRGRTYWTRAFLLIENLVPEFLRNIHVDIFNVGRCMNLLKLCNPKVVKYTQLCF